MQLDTPITPKFGSLAIFRENRVFNSVTNKTAAINSKNELKIITCGTEYFNYSDSYEINKNGFENYYCLKNKSEMKVGGT